MTGKEALCSLAEAEHVLYAAALGLEAARGSAVEEYVWRERLARDVRTVVERAHGVAEAYGADDWGDHR